MAKSALIKSSLAKKYWMALTGLFLCLFLVGHLLGNLQLIFGDSLQFNEYAVFMTSNPAIKIMSYITYFSILFHAVDGILLAVQNQKARPVKYAKNKPETNTIWASRNMAVLGTLILVFIAIHMVNFWARMHFDKNMPLLTKTIEVQPGMTQNFYVAQNGDYIPVDNPGFEIRNRTEVYNKQANVKVADLYKDLHKITVEYFREPDYGLYYTLFYVFSMIVLGFHLYHGFGSAFQSLGLNNPRYNMFIKNFGKAFSIIVPLLFAIIPLYIHFLLKA